MRQRCIICLHALRLLRQLLLQLPVWGARRRQGIAASLPARQAAASAAAVPGRRQGHVGLRLLLLQQLALALQKEALWASSCY
jgi:hypothetical protein